MAVEKKNAPYAPPSNVIAIIRRYRERNLPDVIDINLLQDIGIPKGNIHRTLAALEYLGLIQEDGSPSHTFESIQVATDEEYSSIFESLVRTSYRDVFQVVDPSKDNQGVIDNHFRRYQPTSQRGRMVTLFLALCREGGIPTLDVPRERAIRNAPATKRLSRTIPMRVIAAGESTNAETDRALALPANLAIPTVAELRRSYIAALIEKVKHSGAQGQEPDQELLERIERLLAAEAARPDVPDSLD